MHGLIIVMLNKWYEIKQFLKDGIDLKKTSSKKNIYQIKVTAQDTNKTYMHLCLEYIYL